MSLPTQQEAITMPFPDLARSLRKVLEEAKTQLTSPPQLMMEELVCVLESKIPKSPQRPLDPLLPPKTKLPPEPNRPDLPYTPSSSYKQVDQQFKKLRRRYENKLKNCYDPPTSIHLKNLLKELPTKREKALDDITISEADEKTINIWKKWRKESNNWRSEIRNLELSHEREIEENFLSPHRARLAKWEHETETWRRTHELPIKIIKGLRTDITRFFEGFCSITVERVHWRILPPGETGERRLREAIRNYQQRHPELRINQDRINFALSFKPTHCYVGEEGFDGYFAFEFDKTSKVLLENPIEGNALYIFRTDWRRLSKLSKTELLHDHKRQFRRIFHQDGWRKRLRKVLGIVPTRRRS
jgi:hypothetical protein